jgi:hypothetical protein
LRRTSDVTFDNLCCLKEEYVDVSSPECRAKSSYGDNWRILQGPSHFRRQYLLPLCSESVFLPSATYEPVDSNTETAVLPLVLYRREIWSLTLSGERNWVEQLDLRFRRREDVTPCSRVENFTDVSEYAAVIFNVEVCRARNWSGRLQETRGEKNPVQRIGRRILLQEASGNVTEDGRP